MFSKFLFTIWGINLTSDMHKGTSRKSGIHKLSILNKEYYLLEQILKFDVSLAHQIAPQTKWSCVHQEPHRVREAKWDTIQMTVDGWFPLTNINRQHFIIAKGRETRFEEWHQLKWSPSKGDPHLFKFKQDYNDLVQ